MIPLPAAFLGPPLAHRGLHGPGRPENSVEAFEAAAAAGYGIELDVQLTADGAALVFHDEGLARMTGAEGLVRDRALADLVALPLRGGGRMAPLDAVLAAVAGRVPVLVEIKDQSGCLGDIDGRLEAAVARAVRAAPGPVAVMSFNPASVYRMRGLCPEVPRGLTTEDFVAEDEWSAPRAVRERLTAIADFEGCGATFVSHNRRQLGMKRIAELKAAGAAVLCWTVRSPEEEAAARAVAHNVTFEGYEAALAPA